MARVMIVEDESLIRMLVVDLIGEAGFEIVEAATAEEAVPLLEVEGIRLIVTDINTPGRLNGIDLAKAARERSPGIPVVFISGRPGMLADARAIGSPVSFVPKPFKLDRLIAEVKRLVEA